MTYGLKRNGKLQKGCKFVRGGRVVCNTKHRRKQRGLRGDMPGDLAPYLREAGYHEGREGVFYVNRGMRDEDEARRRACKKMHPNNPAKQLECEFREAKRERDYERAQSKAYRAAKRRKPKRRATKRKPRATTRRRRRR